MKWGISSDLEFDYWQARRWARAWKRLARHGDDATDYFMDEISALDGALRNLVDKLDAVAPELQKITMLAWTHGNRYAGPNYAVELETARKLLDAD